MSFEGSDAAAGDRADAFGTVLRTERQRRGVSLRELARLVHYSHGYLSKVERGVMPPNSSCGIRSPPDPRPEWHADRRFCVDCSR
ncbi:helix-turn-helix transcriptional regulator [Actinocrispum sp. NPDC049592]|uniref:helix-turn-helix domain-containing protein n=1 Tax=Actinocrispum sp. NPDC049592 TaxID=3154835 RepID=UPI00342FD1C7